jgi:sporulation protein YlmC with PRC-barrel domain
MTTKLVKGMPVVSLADGATLGTIDHVYFDPERMAVVGFTFHQRGGLFGGGSSGLIDISDVHAFGADAVTVDDVSVVRSDLAVEVGHAGLLDLETLIKRPVMTESGVRLGNVSAIQFGEGSHSLVALDITPEGGGAPARLDAREIKTVGPELIIAADPVAAAGPVVVRSQRVLRAVPQAQATGGPEPRRVDLKVVNG